MSTIRRLSFIGEFLPKILYFTFNDILGRIPTIILYVTTVQIHDLSKVACVRIRKTVLEWIGEAETWFMYYLEQVRSEIYHFSFVGDLTHIATTMDLSLTLH